MQSDWSKTPKLDYATNKEVANYFGANAKWYRTNRFKQFAKVDNYLIPKEVVDRLIKGDTIKIGIDYYGALGVSAQLIPPNIIRSIDLRSGEVKYFNLYVENNKVVWSNHK